MAAKRCLVDNCNRVRQRSTRSYLYFWSAGVKGHAVTFFFLFFRTHRNCEDGIAAVTLYKWQLPVGAHAPETSDDCSSNHATRHSHTSPRAHRVRRLERFYRLHERLLDVARAAAAQKFEGYVTSPSLTTSREDLFEHAKLDGRRSTLTASTREFQVAQLALIKKNTTPETSFAISSVVPSLKGTEKRRCTERLHPRRFTVLGCRSSRVILLSLGKTRTLDHQSGRVLCILFDLLAQGFFMIILCWFTVCYQ